jgi:hypothetical protein
MSVPFNSQQRLIIIHAELWGPSASSRLRIGVDDCGAGWEASDSKGVSAAQEVRCTALG